MVFHLLSALKQPMFTCTNTHKTPLEIRFMYFDNKENYCIFLDLLRNLCFIFHCMLFIS